MCFRFINFIKHLVLPEIAKKSLFEAVLIEFRNFPHLEFTLRNAIYKLGKSWSFTVVCGCSNKPLVEMIPEILEYVNFVLMQF